MTTNKNLEDAFASESQASGKYGAHAKQAAQEGSAQATRLCQAGAHRGVMDGIRPTAENLHEAISAEHSESGQMHPEYMTTAMHKGETAAILTFSSTMEVEKVHNRLCVEVLDRVAVGEDLPENKIYVCSICGNTVMGEPPEACPVCGSAKETFKEIK